MDIVVTFLARYENRDVRGTWHTLTNQDEIEIPDVGSAITGIVANRVAVLRVEDVKELVRGGNISEVELHCAIETLYDSDVIPAPIPVGKGRARRQSEMKGCNTKR
jgi:hypothetical protein